MYHQSLRDKLVFKSYGDTAVRIIFNHLNVLDVGCYSTGSMAACSQGLSFINDIIGLAQIICLPLWIKTLLVVCDSGIKQKHLLSTWNLHVSLGKEYKVLQMIKMDIESWMIMRYCAINAICVKLFFNYAMCINRIDFTEWLFQLI